MRKFGSSPHGRGTVAYLEGDTLKKRFIPAWAGNRSWPANRYGSNAVHPRMGGEQTSYNIL